MIELVIKYLTMFFVSLVVFLIFADLYKRKRSVIEVITLLILLPLTLMALYEYVPPIIRMPLIILLYIAISYGIYSKNLKAAIIDSLFIEVICILAEAIYTFFYLSFNMTENLMIWNHTFIGMILSNIIIPLLMLIIFKLPITKLIYKKIVKMSDTFIRNSVLFYIIFFFSIINILLYSVYFLYYSNKSLLFLIITLVMVLYTMILIIILNTQYKFDNIKSKYTLSLENLTLYEKMLNQYKVANHENRNQLLLIRNMFKNKKAIEYIDNLIDNKDRDNNDIYNKVKMIPLNSIRAAIYSKLLLISNKSIKYSIVVDRKISSKNFVDLSSSTILDICNILNVFLDNAIDEASKYTDGQILIEFNKLDRELEIAVSNTCKDEVSIDKLYDIGYSTKEGDHGYGLPIVQSTVYRSKILRNKTEYINNIFTQYIYIKVK